MIDNYGRNIDYVRISVTERCNLRCVYCMPEKGIEQISHDEIIRYDEIIKLCSIFAKLGVKKIKLTGGEPLVRKGIDQLIKEIKGIEGIESVSITTNGILLEDNIDKLSKAGLDAINVSLDTLDATHFSLLTRGGKIEDVLSSMDKVLAYPNINLKTNCVSNNISDQEIMDIVLLAKNKNIHVRFIELMPIGMGKEMIDDDKQYIDQEQRIKDLLTANFGKIKEYEGKLGHGPSRYFEVEGFMGKVGFISAISHKFCDSCNRVRLSSKGYLKTCLQYDIGSDLLSLLRNGSSNQDIEDAIIKTIQRKPKAHGFLEKGIESGEQKSMSQIGG